MTHFANSAKEEGEGIQKTAGKIRYHRRDVFADDPLTLDIKLNTLTFIFFIATEIHN